MPDRLQRITRFVLGPLLLAQGRRARRQAVLLPEAAGPRSGAMGEGPPLRLLIVGDSAAAGVGAATQDEAFAGRLVAALAAERRVAWRLAARSGATTAHALALLADLPDEPCDAAVTALGVNDAVRGVSVPQWLEQQRRLRDALRARGATHVVVCGVPPLRHFPALPQPLRWYLGRHAARLDAALAADTADEPGTTYLSLDLGLDAARMAPDGYHPGPLMHADWGRGVAAVLAGGGRRG